MTDCRIDRPKFGFARARVYGRVRAHFFFFGRLSGLIFAFVLTFPACTARQVSVPAPVVDSNRFDDLTQVDRIEMRRANRRTGGVETVTLTSTQVRVRRNVKNFERSLAVEPAVLASLAEKIRSMGEVVVLKNRSQERMEMTLSVHSGGDVRSLILDPEDKLHPVYAEVMRLREDALKNGE